MGTTKMRDKRKTLSSENQKESTPLKMFPQYDLTKDVRFELMKKVFGSTHLHKRHVFLTKDTERECRFHDRHKKMVEVEFVRQKQKVENHFLKLINNSHITTDDLRYSYNNWQQNGHSKVIKQKVLEKATLECTVTQNDGKETYIPVKTKKELIISRHKKVPKPDVDNAKIARFPLFRDITM